MSPCLRALVFASTFLLAPGAVFSADEVRPIPPPGIAVPDEVRAELTEGAAALAKAIAQIRESTKPADVLRELPNIELFHKAVDWALRYDEFFDPKQFEVAREQLAQGYARLAALQKKDANGVLNPPWNSATGLVVRAYRSEIDGSVQPYGLVIPADWKPNDGKAWPLHFWCHGRGEKLTELAFIDERQRQPGEFTPPGAIVCHLYGRFCNANKFAGERDLFEALDDIKKHYRIDDQRLVMRGFSMGGAAAWQFATHHSGMWAAAAPGAGFAETAEFFKVFAPGKTPPPWWEQVLWRWYDSTTMAANLANTKTVAYSGEIDAQKQAADIMVRYAKEEGVEFPHIIGPQAGHKYHPDSKPQIEEFVSAAVKEGREIVPKRVRFTTYSLIYPQMEWITIRGLEKQWERGDVEAELTPDRTAKLRTRNVTQLSIPGGGVNAYIFSPHVEIDGQSLSVPAANDYRFLKLNGRWEVLGKSGVSRADLTSRKRPTVCGPVDHAFMSPFVFVAPSGPALNETISTWVTSELAHAKSFWRKVFRGDAPMIADTAVTEQQIKNANLILWGDPSSNALLKKIIEKLPLKWSAETLEYHGAKYDAAHHAPILIFPNPLNPSKYVVLNSGPTFREEALLNNSDQTPKLPDWAIIDLRTPPGPKWPGEVVDAGFFDEQWQP